MRGRPKKEQSQKAEFITFSAPAGTKKMLKFLKQRKVNNSEVCAKAIKRTFKRYAKAKNNLIVDTIASL